MNILEKVTLGEYYFSTAILLRESMFVNGILTNAEIWYGLTKAEVGELEDLDEQLLRQIGANVVRAHERFPCGGRRSGH